MQQLGLRREDEYFTRLSGEVPRIVEAELRHLLNLVTVTETCFFRDAGQFRLLTECIVPSLVEGTVTRPPHGRTVRIWSAGCSSGEEAYSIAIALDDAGVFERHPDVSFEISGTDLNSGALERARAGVYGARAVRNVERRLLERYFLKDGKTFVVRDDIRRRVQFEFGNVIQTPMPSSGPQDVIFCKNVAIYFRAEVTHKLILGLHDTLTAGGFLVLGHAESLWQMADGFALVEHERAFCYRKKPAVTAPAATRTGAAAAVRRSPPIQTRSAEYDMCLAAFRRGEWDAAEAALTSLVSACPTFVPARILLGGLYANRGRFDDAVAQAERALEVSEFEPRAHLLLGMIAARRRRTEEALLSLRRALYLDNSLALAHFWLGNLYRDRGDAVRARQEYENVVRDWERRTFQLTEEFAAELTAEQLVSYCGDRLQDTQPADTR